MDPLSAALAQRDFEKAEAELSRGNVLAALACLEAALKIWNNPYWHSRLGYCIAKERGHLTRAFELCRSSMEHDPGNPEHYYYLSKVHQIAADNYQAIQTLREGMLHGGSPDIEKSLQTLGTRKPPVLPFLSRSNSLNKYLGIIFARLKLR